MFSFLYKKGLLNFKYNSLNAHNYVSLGEIAKIYQPQTLSQSSLDYGKYNVFGANGIIGKHSKYNHKLEQVTISCRGENAGIINITPELCWINGNSMVINIDNNINYNKFFLKYILEKQNLKYMISGSGQPQITREVVLKHKIPNLTLPTQLQFIRELIIIDKKIRLENIKYNYTISLKKGLMQNMFV